MPADKSNLKVDPSECSRAALNAKAAYLPNDLVLKLMAVGKDVVTGHGWSPSKDGKTFCNLAAALAASNLKDYEALSDADGEPLLANEQIRVIKSDPKHWKKVGKPDAWNNAVLGGLGFALSEGLPHGHIALIAPTAKVWSHKWQAYLPSVYNVGKTMNLSAPYTIGAGYAFLKSPEYYIYVA